MITDGAVQVVGLPLVRPYVCVICGSCQKSDQALTMHYNIEHRLRNKIRWCVDTEWCPACGLIFANRSLRIEHIVQKSPICFHTLEFRGPVINDEQAADLDAIGVLERKEVRKKGLGAHVALRPLVRIFGPHLHCVDLQGYFIDT